MPILLIATSRPDRDAVGWRIVGQVRDQFGEAMTEITLRPLSSDESQVFIELGSATTNEVRAIEAKVPASAPRVVLSRKSGREGDADHRVDERLSGVDEGLREDGRAEAERDEERQKARAWKHLSASPGPRHYTSRNRTTSRTAR